MDIAEKAANDLKATRDRISELKALAQKHHGRKKRRILSDISYYEGQEKVLLAFPLFPPGTRVKHRDGKVGIMVDPILSSGGMLDSCVRWEGEEKPSLVCPTQLEICPISQPSDCLKESVDFSAPPNSSADLNGKPASKSTKTQLEFCEVDTSIQSLETSETTAPLGSISSWAASLAPEPLTPELEPDSNIQNQSFGGKCSGVSMSQTLTSWSSRTQKVCAIEDLEQLSEGLPKSGMWGNGSVFPQPTLEPVIFETESLRSPTLTACDSNTTRPAGQTKCEIWWRNNILRHPFLQLSAPAMAMLLGFPPEWMTCLSESQTESLEELEADTSLAEASFPNKQPSPSPELNISTLVSISTLELSRELQQRFATNSEVIAQYAHLLDLSEPPPIEVFKVDDRLLVVNGFHRVAAKQMAGHETISAVIKTGTWAEAVLESCAANAYNGLRPSNSERRSACLTYLNTISQLPEDDPRRNQSLREVGALLGVSHQTVRSVHKEIEFSDRIKRLGIEKGSRVRIKDEDVKGSIFAINAIKCALMVERDIGYGAEKISGWLGLEQIELVSLEEEEAACLETASQLPLGRTSAGRIPALEEEDSSHRPTVAEEVHGTPTQGKALRSTESKPLPRALKAEACADVVNLGETAIEPPQRSEGQLHQHSSPPQSPVSRDWLIGFKTYCESFTDEEIKVIWDELVGRFTRLGLR